MMRIAHFFTPKASAIRVVTDTYISAIVADMKMRASYNHSPRNVDRPFIVADMKMRASYNAAAIGPNP